MPRHCSVYGCKSNYESQLENVTTFSLPKNESERSQWLRKIPTDLSNVKKPVICAKHFPDDYVIRVDRIMVNGEMKEFARKCPKLKEGLLPCVFPNLTPTSSNTRLTDVESTQVVRPRLHRKHKKMIDKEDSIGGLADVLRYLDADAKALSKNWATFDQSNRVVMCFLDFAGKCPQLCASIVVSDTLQVEVYVRELRPDFLRKDETHKLKSRRMLRALIAFVENMGTAVPVVSYAQVVESSMTEDHSRQRKKKRCT